MERILFSPIGNTDPIRDCYDGGCLHIVRHYHPDKVVLFFTKEMAAREDANHCYTRAIRHVAPECVIEEIRTDIVDAHLYDSFIEVLPREVRKLKGEDREILLNLSSGTPQIKTMMAILSVEDGLTGVQVVSPNKASNSKSIPVQAEDDVEAMLVNNFDDDPEAENRCQEPPLQAIRYFSERQRLISLIRLYEYKAALELARGSVNISKEVKDILRHAELRQRGLRTEARKVLTKLDGINLFVNLSEIKRDWEREDIAKLIEFLLNLVVTQRKGYLEDFLVKSTSYLCELLKHYLQNGCSRLPLKQCMQKDKLLRRGLEEYMPELLQELDIQWPAGYRDSELSFLLLHRLCCYAQKKGLADDEERMAGVADILDKLAGSDGFRRMRNTAAHGLEDLTEQKFRERIGISSGDFAMALVKLSEIILPYGIKQLCHVYDTLNSAIEKRLGE